MTSSVADDRFMPCCVGFQMLVTPYGMPCPILLIITAEPSYTGMGAEYTGLRALFDLSE